MMAFPVGIVEAGDHVNIFLERLERLQARRDIIIGPQLARHPVILHDPVAVDHSTKRDSIAVVPVFAAYAVPLLLNIAASGGNPMRTAMPPSPTPFRNERRETAIWVNAPSSKMYARTRP